LSLKIQMQKKLTKNLILLFILHQVRTCQDEVGELEVSTRRYYDYLLQCCTTECHL